MMIFKNVNQFLSAIGAKRSSVGYVLDGFDSEFYLKFETSVDPRRPQSWGTCDIYFQRVGTDPGDSKEGFRVRAGCHMFDVMRVISAIGINRFDKPVKDVYYSVSNPLREE